MALFLAQRWRQQPTGPVTVNWSHPLANNLRALQICGRVSSAVAEWWGVRGNPVALPPLSGAARAVHLVYGSGNFAGVNTQDYGQRDVVRPSAAAASATLIYFGTTSTSTFGGNEALVSTAQNTGAFLFGIEEGLNNVAGRIRGRVYTSTYVYTSTFDADTSARRLYAFRHTHGTGQELLVDEEVVATSSATAARGFADTSFGAFSGGRLNTRQWLRGLFGRAVPNSELREWRTNPYQVLSPLRPIIYSFPSAATAPTLSAATVTDITSTSARPRVTVTF